MAQPAQFAGPEDFALHQKTIDYGKALIAERNQQGLALDTLPPAWTPFRAHLSEALEYVAPGAPSECILNGIVVACVMDENCGDRTYLDSEIAIFQICTSITSAYGGRDYVERRDNVLKCWKRTCAMSSSLVLIQAPGFSSKTVQLSEPTHYVVLDHFRVSLIWFEENEDGEPVYYTRLEKCNLQTKSWWTPRQRDPPVPREFLGQHEPFMSPPCSSCGLQSPRVYKEALLCFNNQCNYFCQSMNSGSMEVPEFADLTFDDGFLLYRKHVKSTQRPPFPLVRDVLNDLNSLTTSALSHSKKLLHGIVCSRCRAIIPKVYWHNWKCETCPPDVPHEYPYNPGRIDLQAVVSRTFVSYPGHPPLNFNVPRDLGQAIPNQHKDFYMVDKWFLHDGCQLLVLSPTSILNEDERGPDMIFSDMLNDANSGALRLHRYKEQEPPALDDHYQSSWGAEYGFDGFQNTSPLQQAPLSVSKARELLNHIGQMELRNASESNAVQVFGFMQDQGLQWHTDGEGELGETQSMLNLGGDAILKIRLQKTHYTNENAFARDGEVVRGAKNWEKAAKIKALAAQGKRPNDADLYELSHGPASTPQPEARIPLIHGSIVIMQGRSFSKYYEHSLETSGPLTFAVVTRTIDEQKHQELLNTKYAVNSERPNGQLFTRSFEDPGETDATPSPEPTGPIPIVIQHVRPHPAAVPHQPYLAQAAPARGRRRSPSTDSARSGTSNASLRKREMVEQLYHLRTSTTLTFPQIREQEGWDTWSETAMTTAMHRETQRRQREGTHTSPSPSATSSTRHRRPPRPKTQASAAGSQWTDEESDKLWAWHQQNLPNLEYKDYAVIDNNRRTIKAYREHVHTLVRQRGGLSSRGNRLNTQQRRATLTATRQRAVTRQETPQMDVPDVPPVPTFMPVAVPSVQDAHRADDHVGTRGDQGMSGTSDEENDEVQPPMVRRTRGSGQRST